MKKMIIMVGAIMMALAANAQRVETESFNKVLVNVPSRVRVVPGDSYSVHVATTDSVLAKSLHIDVEEGVLKIVSKLDEAHRDADATLRLIIVAPVEPRVEAGQNCLAKTLVNTYPSDKKDVAASK